MEFSPQIPAGLLRDVLVHVGSEDKLVAATPAAIPWLRDVAGDAQSFADLPLSHDQLVALREGGFELLVVDGTFWELSLSVLDDCRWLRACDVSERERAASRELELLRLRALGAMAGTIAHDLNHHFNAALGIVGHAQMQVGDAAEQRLLGELERGTKAGARMASVVARWLARSPSPRELVPAKVVLDDALAVLRKAMAARGVKLEVDAESSLPSVRTVAIEAGQAVMHGLNAIVAAGASSLRLAMALQPAALPTSKRQRVRLTCEAMGVEQQASERLAGFVQAQNGMLSRLANEPELEHLLGAVVAQRRLGGDLAASAEPGVLRLDYYWPVAGAASCSAVAR